MSADSTSVTRLDSWKEIAAFFGRAERTVKRWETERGLPVHRVPSGGRTAVFASTSELTEWLRSEGHKLDEDHSSSGQVENHQPDSAESPAQQASSPASISVTISPITTSRVTAKNWPPSRLLAWLVPLILATALVVAFTTAHRPLHLKAQASRHIPSTEAQELYLKGRYFWERRTPDDLNKALDFFTQAIVKDPSDAQAYIGLADSYNLLREFGAIPPSEAYPRAISAAQRAVELDDTSAEAHISLAFGTYWWSWQGVTAEREFKRALALNPNLVRAHHWYATYLLGMGRFPEAIDQIEQARRLDPSSNAILADKGFLLWQAGRKDEGYALLTQLETSSPSLSSTHDYLAKIYWDKKDYSKSLMEKKRAAQLRHDESGLAIANAGEQGFAAKGLQGMYESELPIEKDQLDHGSGNAYALATTYAALAKKQEALACLQISFDRHEAAMLMGDPILELLNDPEYLKFRAQVQERLTR